MSQHINPTPKQTDLTALNSKIGTLSSLTTTAKTSAVDAINEVNSNVLWKTMRYTIKANSSGVATLTFKSRIDIGLIIVSFHADADVSNFGGICIASVAYVVTKLHAAGHNIPSDATYDISGYAYDVQFTINASDLPNCEYTVRVTMPKYNFADY